MRLKITPPQSMFPKSLLSLEAGTDPPPDPEDGVEWCDALNPGFAPVLNSGSSHEYAGIL